MIAIIAGELGIALAGTIIASFVKHKAMLVKLGDEKRFCRGNTLRESASAHV
jgi:hypothetical protein